MTAYPAYAALLSYYCVWYYLRGERYISFVDESKVSVMYKSYLLLPVFSYKSTIHQQYLEHIVHLTIRTTFI